MSKNSENAIQKISIEVYEVQHKFSFCKHKQSKFLELKSFWQVNSLIRLNTMRSIYGICGLGEKVCLQMSGLWYFPSDYRLQGIFIILFGTCDPINTTHSIQSSQLVSLILFPKPSSILG